MDEEREDPDEVMEAALAELDAAVSVRLEAAGVRPHGRAGTAFRYVMIFRLSPRDTASILDVTVNTVYSHVHRVLAKLRSASGPWVIVEPVGTDEEDLADPRGWAKFVYECLTGDHRHSNPRPSKFVEGIDQGGWPCLVDVPGRARLFTRDEVYAILFDPDEAGLAAVSEGAKYRKDRRLPPLTKKNSA